MIRFGLPEWRKTSCSKPQLLLPIPAEEALVQGQSTELVLKEGRFFDLVQDSIDDYDSIVGMALLGDDDFLPTFPLCEIQHYQVHSGYRGKVTVSVTLRAVGRATLTQVTQWKPVMMGMCQELVDEPSPNMAVANALVDDMNIILEDLSRNDGRYQNAIVTERTVSEMTRASWSVFMVLLTDKSRFYEEAIATVDVVDRLRLCVKALLDEKFQLSGGNNDRTDTDFESSTFQ